jgi:hypothetical protein
VASSSRKRSAVLCDEGVREYLLVSKSEESFSHSAFDSDNELEDCTLVGAVVNGDSYEGGDDYIQDIVWDNMEHYKGQR